MVKYRGMGLGVKAFRELQIDKKLQSAAEVFTDYGDLTLPRIESDSGPPDMRNFATFKRATETIREAARQVSREDFVFCLGGECGLVVGSLAGFRSTFKGRPGMLWLDAHGDFNTPQTTPSGFIGGMPLALACGRGPKLAHSVDSLQPLVEEECVVHVGNRDLDPMEAEAMKASAMQVHSAEELRSQRIKRVAEHAATHLADRADWIICHLDLDVLDPSIMPAVDFPSKDGLTLREATTIIHAAQETGKLKVFNLTAFDPTKEKHRSSGTIRKLVSSIM